MTRLLRCLLAAGALGAGLVMAGPVGAQEGPPETPSGDPAIDELVGCVQTSRRLLVLFLIDESASLKVSDPDNRRVDAARAALDSLLALATTEGDASPAVDVAFAAFSNEYRTVEDWTEASETTADDLRTSVEGFADLNQGIDTDFVNALSSGREALAERAAFVTDGGGAPPCRAVLLFTDGGFDLAVRESAADQERLGTTKPYAPGIELTSEESVVEAEAAGRGALCDPGGLADELRLDGVTLLTLALSGDVARRSQLPLAAASAGTADNYVCGTPTERPPGAYLPAEGVDVLVARFLEVGARLAGGNLLPDEQAADFVVCGADPCPEGTRTFTLDPSLRRVQVLALAPEAGTVVRLVGPGGDVVDLDGSGSEAIGGAEVVASEVAGRGLTLNIDRPEDPAAWTGEWSVSVLDPSDGQTGKSATLQVFVFSDIGVRLEQGTAFIRGETTDLLATLEAPEGVELGDVVTAVSGEVRVRNPVTGAVDTVALEGPPQGPFAARYDVPADLTVNGLEVSAELRISTSSGAELISQSLATEELVRRPGAAIQLLPASLSLPSLTGSGSTATELLLLGGAEAGCVWFGESDVPDPPAGAGPIVLQLDGSPLPGEDDCIPVAANETTTIVIQAEPSGRGAGAVRGTLQVFEKTEGAPEPSQTDLLFRFDLARGVDSAQRALLVVALLAGGLALPMLALLLINALTARFQTLDVVRGAALPVLVGSTSISRVDGPYPKSLTFRDDDFGSLTGLGSDRRFRFGGVEFRAKASRNPFGATVALAAPEGGAERLKGNAGSRVELDPGLAGSWVFLLDPTKTRRLPRDEAEGLLIAFVAEGDVSAQTGRMLSDVQGRLPSTASRLAGLVRAAAPKTAKRKHANAAPAAGEAESESEADPDVEVAVDEPVGDGPDDGPPAAPPAGFTGGRPSG